MKKIAALLIAIIVVTPLIFFGALLLILSKPEYYQEEIQDAFFTETGLNLEIESISWRYWPPIALKIDSVNIRNPETRQSIAQLNSAAVDIDLLPLVTGNTQIQVKGFTVDQLKLELIVDSFGNRNWEPITGKTKTQASANGKQASNSANDTQGVLNLMPFGIRQLEITSSVIHYQDEREKQNLTFVVRDFHTDSVEYDQPFTLGFDFNLVDEVLSLDTDIQGTVSILLDSNTHLVSMNDIQVDGSLALNKAKKLPMSLNGQMTYDIGKDTLQMKSLRASLSDLLVELDLAVKDIANEPSGLNGSIKIDPFNPKKLLADLNLMHLELTDANAFEKLQLSLTLKSDLENFETKDLKLQLDKSTFNGTARASVVGRPMININVDIDTIDLADYAMPPTLETTAQNFSSPSTAGMLKVSNSYDSRKTKTHPMDSLLIPRNLIESYTINAHLFVTRLLYDTIETSSVKLHLSTASNKMKVTAKGNLYGGSFKFELADNPDDLETSGYSTFSTLGADVTGLTGFDWITGKLDIKSHIEFSDYMLSDVLNSLNGPSSFRISNGTLDVTPIKKVAGAIEFIQRKPSSISQWPDKVAFKELEGHHRFSNGQQNQMFDFVVENLRVDGRGGIEYLDNRMEYDISAVIRQSQHGQFKVSDDLADVRWPIKCKGKLDDSPMDICKPKKGAIEDIIKDKAKKKFKAKAKDKLESKAKKLLKGLFN